MNKIHRAKHKNMRGRGAALAMALFLLIGCLCIPDMEVLAESLSVRASASSVKIGDTVTISITVPGGISATVNLTYPGNLFSFQSASETANSNGGTVSMTLGGYGGTDTATTGTVTFKAKAAGTATFSASAPVAGNQEGDQVSLGGGSASVTVQNETSGGNGSGGSGGNGSSNGGGNGGSSNGGGNGGSGNGGGNGGDDDSDDEANKSPDNSLSSLTLSAGKLSPSFRYNVVNYTATVDYNTTSVVVSAKTSNANATIESVKGGESLSVGDNRIQIVVKAENGVTATYTITVTRKASGEADDPADEPLDSSDDPADEPLDPSGSCFVVDGKELYPSETIPEGVTEADFEQGEINLWGQTYPSFVDTFFAGELQLVYLVEEGGDNGGLYLILSSHPQEAYNYVRLNSKKGFIIVLPDGDGNVPDAYAAMPTVFDTEGYGKIDAWFSESGRELALVYAVNQEGIRGWYTLDTASLSYVRYQEPAVQVEAPEPSTEQSKEPSADNSKLQELKKQNHLIIGIAAIVVLILLIVIILMAVIRHGRDDEEDEDTMTGYDRAPMREENVRRKESGPVKKDDRLERSSKDQRSTVPQEKDKKTAPVQKRFDKSMFGSDYLRDVMADIDPDSEYEDVDERGKSGSKEEVELEKELPKEDFEPKAFIDIGELERKWGLSGSNADAKNKENSTETDNDLLSMETGLAEEMEREMAQEVADQISRIADPAPMQSVSTHKDKDDEDLEFIDL